MADYLNIAGRVRTTASDGVGIEAQEVKDLNLNKSQQEINADVQTELGDRYTKEETYSKEQLDDLITTPDVNHVSVVATDATTAVTDILPVTGEANTIYRVGNWNGTQYDPTMYALYAWNGSAYVCLAVRSFVGEVYDISANHPDGQGNPTPYAGLAAALGTSGANIPADIRRGGMRIQFIQGNAQSSDNKYVQFRFMLSGSFTDAQFTNVDNWQGVDDELTPLSKNLIESGAVEKPVSEIKDFVGFEAPTYVDVDLSQLTENAYGILSNYWRNAAGYGSPKCYRVPVNVGDRYKITANSSNKAYYAFLTSATPLMNGAVDYSSGGKAPVDVGQSVEIIIPDNTAYLYIQTEINGDTYTPQSLQKIVSGSLGDIYETKTGVDNKIAASVLANRLFWAAKTTMDVYTTDAKPVTFNPNAKTILFYSGTVLIDRTTGRRYSLGSDQTVSMGAWSMGIIYYDASDSTIKFKGILTAAETDAVYDSYHKVRNYFVIASVCSESTANTSPYLAISANYYVVGIKHYGYGYKEYTDNAVAEIKDNFTPDYLHSEWYVGDVTKLANANVKSVITAIKDVWFEFPYGKPAGFDNWILRFTCVFRPDFTGSPSPNDTLFQFRIYPNGKDGTSGFFNFYRWEFVSTNALAFNSKTITIGGVSVRIIIYANISAYTSIIPVPRDDTNFMLWSKVKSTSIYKDSDEYALEKTKIWYGGSKLYVTDQFPVTIFKSGLSINKQVKTISLSTKMLPLLANYEAEPNTPAAYARLKQNTKNNNIPYYASSDALVSVDYEHAGDYMILSPNCEVFEGNKYGVALNVVKKKKSEITNTSINVLCFGASSTDQGLASYTRWLFEDLGLTFNGVGTKYDYYGTKCEGRGGWAYAMYTGISSLSNQDTIVPLAESGATITEYQNPFLFLATADDKTNHPEWCFRRSTNGSHAELSYETDEDKTGDFYIFDFARYMDNHSVETPDLITIQLGMNDFYTDKYSPSQALTNCVLGLTIIYSQIRAALPNVPIAIIPYMPRYTNTGGINQVKNIRNYTDALNEFISDHSTDTKLHVINCQCLMSPDYIWDMTDGSAIDDSGNTTSALALGTPGDGVHFNKNGYVEFARVVGTWIMTQMS